MAENQIRGSTQIMDDTITGPKVTADIVRTDGVNPMTGSLDFGGNRITDLADGINPQDAATVAQLAGGGSGITISEVNKEGATIHAGQPVSPHGSGTGVRFASAADDSRNAIGLMTTDTASLAAGIVRLEGTLTLADWTLVTGTVTLAALGLYFLDPATPGMLTLTPPITPGQVLQSIGEAIAPDTLTISVDTAILL